MKYKFLLALWSFLFISDLAFAQDSLSLLSPKRFGFTFQLSSPNPDDINVGWFNIDRESLDDHNLLHKSYALGGMFHYYADRETSLRLRFGLTRTYVEEYNEERYNGQLQEYSQDIVSGEQLKLQFAPGIAWEMGAGKLKIFAGFELPFNFHGDYHFKTAYVVQDSNKELKYKSESVIILPKGFSGGIGAIGGFRYNLQRHFSLGAEFAPSLLYARLSGKTKLKDSPPSPVGRDYLTQDENKGFTFYEQRFSINLSYWFDL